MNRSTHKNQPKRNLKPRNQPKKGKNKKQQPKSPFSSTLVVQPMNRARPKRQPVSSFTLSKCALAYARALVDPFHPSVRQACLPVFPAPLSHKVTAFARYTMQLGTAGYGFMTISPSLANDLPIGYLSTSLYTAASALPLIGGSTFNVGVSRVLLPNIPYNASQLLSAATAGGQVASGRIVSCGVRITYTGTTLNESGVYYIFSSPIHENVLTFNNTPALVSSQADVDICGVTRKSCSARIFPVAPSEASYTFTSLASPVASPTEYTYPYSSNDFVQNSGYTDDLGLPAPAGVTPYVGSPVCIIQATGVAGSSFLIEYVQHMEYTGVATASNATVSDSDQRGFEIVTAAAQRVPSIIQSTRASPTSAMMSALSEVASALKPIAIKALVTAVGAMVL